MIDLNSPHFFRFIRLMRRWCEDIGAFGLCREKNRLGRGPNLGSRGEIWASGAPNDFSWSSGRPYLYTHYSEEPKEQKSIRAQEHKALRIYHLSIRHTTSHIRNTSSLYIILKPSQIVEKNLKKSPWDAVLIYHGGRMLNLPGSCW